MPRRTDHNQSPIVAELRQLGFRCHSTHKVGDGAPDILVAGMKHSTPTLLWVELKSVKGQLNPKQKDFHAEWHNYPVLVARSTEDVLRWFGWDEQGTGLQRSDSEKR